ncbi:C4-dicarboxylate ABC transporter permease [Desulfosarcina widdelii]|uniref:C4-dicarboxylate ABC transporter permease n=1 Tax=Desulfosarcina widdelii TaxID=947919 RepID=A0A5K7YYU6_9BACT|nr:TRAP transporter large permease [Desulfosarcina widdelii]BBO73093.1 C4-dicarboxylate ABC transporter permease [Desulfosarcina widdelii]
MIPEPIVLFIVFLYFIVFLAVGQNVATVLLGTGVIGIVLWTEPSVIISFIESDVFDRISTYSFITIPLYILMAFFLLRGGVIKEIYYFIHKLGGKKKTPLAILTVVMGALLGAVSGSSTAISAGLAVTAAPELQRYGYKKNYSVALGAIGGSLSALVPPSIIIIIYASISELSIGKLFMGAMIPGILLTIVFSFIIFIFDKFRPAFVLSSESMLADNLINNDMAIEEDFYDFKTGLISFSIVMFLIFLVFGGIYGGIMTATEAGGVAAFVSMIAMVVRKKLTFQSFGAALVDTARMSSMILIIVVGAQFFGRFMSLSMIPRQLIELLEPLMGQPYLIVSMLLIVLFVLGMILESAAVMVMIIPVTDPIIRAVGIDPIWFGVMASFIIMLGLLTPPVGLASYAASTAAALPVGGIFRYTLIFAFLSGIIIAPFLFIFPEIITFLPNLMIK